MTYDWWSWSIVIVISIYIIEHVYKYSIVVRKSDGDGELKLLAERSCMSLHRSELMDHARPLGTSAVHPSDIATLQSRRVANATCLAARQPGQQLGPSSK